MSTISGNSINTRLSSNSKSSGGIGGIIFKKTLFFKNSETRVLRPVFLSNSLGRMVWGYFQRLNVLNSFQAAQAAIANK